MTFPPVTYPPTRRDPVNDIYHGVTVADPYRWLEDPESSDTQAWIDAQNALTRRILDGPLRERLRAELTRLYDYERISAPERRGSRYFFTHNAGLQDQPVLYVQERLDGIPRVLLDPNALSADGTVALTAWEPSPDGRYMAYALSNRGSDWQEIFVRDVASATDLPDRLQWAKFVTVAWQPDSSGFLFTRFPENANYDHAVYRHVLGVEGADCVFGGLQDPDLVIEADHAFDDVFVFTISRGASDRSAMVIYRQAGRDVQWLIDNYDAAWRYIDAADGEIYFRTTAGAPHGRVVRLGRDGRLLPVIPELADVLVDARLIRGHIAVQYLHNASSRVSLFSLDGQSRGEIALPLGSVTEMTSEADGDELFLRFASFTCPPTVLRYSMATHDASPFRPMAAGPVQSPGSESQFSVAPRWQTEQVWYPSGDGTAVSMFLVHGSVLTHDGSRPVWLTGYGGFNINVLPDFDPAHLLWLERGGVLAVPNLRGGGEYGQAWHEAGMLDKKQNVFDDFIAAAEWLIGRGYTREGRLVLEGGSNGGLLVAVVLTQRPDLPGAVVCRVPVADMLRYHRFTVGRFWIPEYGSADVPEQFTFLHRYSPLHAVRDDVGYPPVLITTAETDDRVDPGMARKLAARLQAACTVSGGGPALVRIERRAGHGAGKPVTKQIDEDADIYAFVASALNFAEAATES